MKLQGLIATLRCDLKRMARDRFLLGAAFFVIAIAVALRFLLPQMHEALLRSQDLDLSAYFPLISSYFVLVNAQMVSGLIVGFLFIESREEDVVRALMVSSARMRGVTLAQLLLCGGLSIIFTLILGLCLGIGAPSFSTLCLLALLASPMSAAYALLLGVLAENKVQAFAAAKILSVLGMVPPVAYFIATPYQYFAGLVPIYWPCKIWWTTPTPSNTIEMLTACALVSLTWLGVLLKTYHHRISPHRPKELS